MTMLVSAVHFRRAEVGRLLETNAGTNRACTGRVRSPIDDHGPELPFDTNGRPIVDIDHSATREEPASTSKAQHLHALQVSDKNDL